MAENAQRTCPRCGARLAIERVDHQLSGHERLLCPRHGVVGHLGMDRDRVYSRHRDDQAAGDDG